MTPPPGIDAIVGAADNQHVRAGNRLALGRSQIELEIIGLLIRELRGIADLIIRTGAVARAVPVSGIDTRQVVGVPCRNDIGGAYTEHGGYD